jgi:hypothetical protein
LTQPRERGTGSSSFTFGATFFTQHGIRQAMAIEKVRAYFEASGIAGRITEFDVGTATVAEAAVSCAGQRIARTLSSKLAGGCALNVAAGDAKVDNAKYKSQPRLMQAKRTPSYAGCAALPSRP